MDTIETCRPVHYAVQELRHLMEDHAAHARNGILFICHSPGGLVARKYPETWPTPVRSLITMATPHHSTSMARWPVYVSPLTSLLYQVLKGFSKGQIDLVLERVLGFLSSSGLRELLPESHYYSGLKDSKQGGTRYISIGDTNPDLLKPVLPSLPELLSRVVPDIIVPAEMREGYGDGLVRTASSRLSYSNEHRNFPVNHASVLFDRAVRHYIVKSAASC